MILVADESVDQPIVQSLRHDGHDVFAVAEMEPSIPDDIVLTTANRKGALLLTADKDFGEIVFHQRRVTEGIVLIRLTGLSARTKATIVSSVIRDHGDELARAFTVIGPSSVRIRPNF